MMEDRSPLQTPDDIRRARERLFEALLQWWGEKRDPADPFPDPYTREGITFTSGEVARTMRLVLRDAESAAYAERSIAETHEAPSRWRSWWRKTPKIYQE